MYEVVSFLYENKELAELSKKIRQVVFVEEQHVSALLEYDGNDFSAVHYLLYNDNYAMGTARWRITEKGVKLERFAVLPSFRNKGAGKPLLKKVIEDVSLLAFPVYLHAQEKAVTYYERAGFVIEGDAFIEAGIRHYKMVLSTNNKVF